MRKRGFTMVEVIIVVAIIAVLASIIIPKMTGARDKAKLENCKANMRHLVTAVSLYNNDHNNAMPPVGNITASHALITEGYLKSAPVCPAIPTSDPSYYFGASSTYAGDYYVYCNNVSSLCHPQYNAGRPVYYFGHGFRYN